MNKFKQLILIATLLPASAMAHDWEQDYWLERLLRNHNKIGDCYDAFINNGDKYTFRDSCSLHAMGYTENKLLAEYHTHRAVHPHLTTTEFIANHFGHAHAVGGQVGILANIRAIAPVVKPALITMYIAEGLTRNDK